jgi:xanthine/uracil/vitamin C permease (AzgA family)
VIEMLGGRLREVRWMSWLIAGLLLAYFVFVRSRA